MRLPRLTETHTTIGRHIFDRITDMPVRLPKSEQGLDLIEPAADMGGGFFGFYLLLKLILVNES